MGKRRIATATFAIFLTTFMSAVEGTIVSTAMPTIVSDLDGLEIMNWVVSTSLLMTAISTPLYGKMADRFGRKPVFLFGISVFVLGSCLCGLSQNMLQLIIFRVVQGLGPGAIQPVAITMLADMYPLNKRAKMIGLNSSFWGLASVIAPLLGGFIVQHLTWHWVFYINLPFGILALLLISFFFKEEITPKEGKLDLQGTIFLVSFLLAFMLFLQGLSEKYSILILGILIALSCASLVLFKKAEQKVADPLMPLEMFRNKEFVAQNAITLLIMGVVIGLESYLSTWMQGINGLSAPIAGFAATPSALMWVVGPSVVGNLTTKLGSKKLIAYSIVLLLIANLSLIIIPRYTPSWVFCTITFFHGLTFGATTTTTQVKSQVIVGKENIGVATAFNTLMKYLGQTIMVSTYGIVFNSVMANKLAQYSKLNMPMMNKVVNSQKVHQLASNLIPDLRNVLYISLQSVYITSFIVIISALIINQTYREK